MPTQSEHKQAGKTRLVFVAVLFLVILTPFAYSIVTQLIAPEAEPAALFLERPDAKYKECVKDTEFMRYHHWELLGRIREEVVRYGIRGEIDLNRCASCHTSRVKFCDKCHNATSLIPDCFGCHYYP